MLSDSPQSDRSGVLLRAVGLTKRYRRGRLFSVNRLDVLALKTVSLSVREGSTLAVIGESGSGKSTLARCLACLEEPDSGEIWFAGNDLKALSHHELIPLRRQIQLVFQEPAASLNPRFTALEIVSEPFLIAGVSKKERRETALRLMELVRLPVNSATRLPREFSGGQRRRLAIARALALQPKVLILDESLAGLDLSTQAQISNLLQELQERCSLTYICISHDLDLVAHLADQVVLFHHGEIKESFSVNELGNQQNTLARRLRDPSLELSSIPAGGS